MVSRASLITFAVIAISILTGYSLGNLYPLTRSAPANGPSFQAVQPQTVKLTVPSFAPFRGADSAKVNVVEFGDYQCPFCERLFQLTEPQVVQNYVDTGRVRFYFLDLAFLGPDSQTLAQGAWCANDQGKYYQYHDYIYSHQGQENSGWATPAKVKILAANVTGLDPQQFNSCLDSQKYAPRVQQLTQLAGSAGATSTPTVLIGSDRIGYTEVVGAQPYTVFQQVIDTQLGKT